MVSQSLASLQPSELIPGVLSGCSKGMSRPSENRFGSCPLTGGWSGKSGLPKSTSGMIQLDGGDDGGVWKTVPPGVAGATGA